MSIIIELPFPDRHLMPNAARRMDWHAKAEYAKTYRMCGFVEAANAVKWDFVPPTGEVELRITFHEPNKRKRDSDGMLSAIKAGLDGIAQRLELNDRQFNPIVLQRGEIVKGGKVVVEIKEGLGW
jgi:crossover junction endodeoxyribonuclease RusA